MRVTKPLRSLERIGNDGRFLPVHRAAAPLEEPLARVPKATSNCCRTRWSEPVVVPSGVVLPRSGLRDANNVEDQKKRHEEGWNQAERKHRHECYGDAVRREQRRGNAECDSSYKIEHAKKLPHDKVATAPGLCELP